MAKAPHYMIIGAGLTGLATARALVDKGARVTIIEKKYGPGMGAGYANSGMIHPSQAWPWVIGDLDRSAQLRAAKSVAKLASHAPILLRKRIKVLGLNDYERVSGCYQIYKDELSCAEAKLRYELIGIEANRAELSGHNALYFPQDFSANALAWSRAEAKSLEADGVQFIYRAQSVMTETRHKARLMVNGINKRIDGIIICAGYDTSSLLEPLGLSLPITGVRGFALDFDAANIDRTEWKDWLNGAPIMDTASRTALTDFHDVIRLSGTLGEISARPLWLAWNRLAPKLMESLGQPKEIWSGERPVCALGRPIIGPTPLEGLWINSGHGHMGWTLALPSAKLLAEMILDGKKSKAFAWPK